MSAYETCQDIRHNIVIRAAEVMNYPSWSDEIAARRIREIPDNLTERVNITELTEAEMDELGFGRWTEDSPMRLIPAWLFKFLPDELECECIDGSKSILKTSEMDADHRFGCLAYGILPSDYARTA